MYALCMEPQIEEEEDDDEKQKEMMKLSFECLE